MVRIKERYFLCTFDSHVSALWLRHVLSPFLLPSLLTKLSTFHIGSSSVISLRDTFQTKPDYLRQHGGCCLVDQGLKILACYRYFWSLLESYRFCHWKNTHSHKSLPFDTMEQMDLYQGCHLDKAILLLEAKPNSLFHHLRVCTDWVWSGWKLGLRLAFFWELTSCHRWVINHQHPPNHSCSENKISAGAGSFVCSLLYLQKLQHLFNEWIYVPWPSDVYHINCCPNFVFMLLIVKNCPQDFMLNLIEHWLSHCFQDITAACLYLLVASPITFSPPSIVHHSAYLMSNNSPLSRTTVVSGVGTEG